MRVLIVYDVKGWAYFHRACALQKYAPPEMEVVICCRDSVQWSEVGSYDLLFWMHFRTVATARAEIERRSLRIPLIVSYNLGPDDDGELWRSTRRHADFVVVNNVHRWQCAGVESRTCAISNGVDELVFRPLTPIAKRPHRCLWVGSTKAASVKGYCAVLLPLEQALRTRGFECDFRLVDSLAAPARLSEMADWYNTGSYILCASIEEGTPNPILEGMACGCVAVSTHVGNVREFARDGWNCLIAERTVESFVEKLEIARQQREELSRRSVETMKGWGYRFGNRARYFYQLWARVICDGVESVSPFRYDQKDWREV